jgi:hypothetical protein
MDYREELLCERYRAIAVPNADKGSGLGTIVAMTRNGEIQWRATEDGAWYALPNARVRVELNADGAIWSWGREIHAFVANGPYIGTLYEAIIAQQIEKAVGLSV